MQQTDDSQQLQVLRNKLEGMLGIPDTEFDLDPEFRGSFVHDGIIVERWIWTSEPGSKVTSLLYRPVETVGPMPAMVITNGHGGSKNSSYNIYTAQLYAKMGIVTLLHDTIGEEERHINGEMGTRAHDDREADQRAANAGRLMMGKILYDVIRGIDFLSLKDYIDVERIGVAGSSLGGAKATWLMALEPRLKAVVISGWGFGEYLTETGKRCTRIPAQKRLELTTWSEYMTLTARNTSVLIMNGEADDVIDQNKSGLIWQQTRDLIESSANHFESHGNILVEWFDPDGGHRAYHNHKDALIWLHHHLGTPGWTRLDIERLPEITLEQWYKNNNMQYSGRYPDLYWVERHHKGAVYADLNITPVSPEKLKVLRPDEIGLPEFTLEGWLEMIER